MNKDGIIIVIEENKENRLLFENIFYELKLRNLVHFFNTFEEARRYTLYEKLKPFLFFSNILQFADSNLQDDENKSFFEKLNCPFLFFSLVFEQCFLIDTFSTPKQSYFSSPYTEEKFKEFVSAVVKYWQLKEEKERKKIIAHY